jgi:acetylornithine/LysW-gamma-L-lysine aminotransferase
LLESEAIITLEEQHSSGVYPRLPIVLVRGQGARLWDARGTEYIDCVGGHGTANIGHCHPAVVRAVNQQIRRLAVCPGGFYNDQRAMLVDRLTAVAPDGLEKAFLCNSGTEAVEAALKFARLSTGRKKIVSAMRGFHGRTFGALSATWRREYRTPFEPLVPGFQFVPYNRLERMREVVDESTAAVLLEVVQGEGGVIPGKPSFLQGVERICRETGALLIIDEVQTGFGRTGRMFACQHYGLQPDLLTLAKSIGGGLPMGAVLIGGRVGGIRKKVHGSTFGGNPLCCAAALATLDVMESENLADQAAEKGRRFLSRLRAIESPLIREVRGLGLMVGIELKQPAASYLSQLAQLGVLALTAGSTVMRFLPPLTIRQECLDDVALLVKRVLENPTDRDSGTRSTQVTAQDALPERS